MNNKTDREALEQRFHKRFANPDRFSSTNQFNPELAGRLYQEFLAFLETETAKAYAKGRKEAVEKALWRVQGICAEYPTNEKTNIPYRVIREACDTALAESDAKGDKDKTM